MAIGYGLGLGLQGTPKDYVELAKNREAAKQKYQAEKLKKQGDDVNEAMKSFAGKAPVESVLPANQRAKDEAIAGFYKTAMANVGVDTPNMMQVYQSATETLSKLNDYNEQFKIFKQLEQNPGNYGLFQSDIDIVKSAKDPNELATLLRERGSGGLDFDPETGFLAVKKIGKFQPASTQLNEFLKNNKDFIFYNREQGTPQKFKVNNTTVEYFGMDEGSKNLFLNSALAGDNYESNRREFRANQLSQGIAPPPQGSPEEIEAVKGYVSSLYDQAALTLLDDRNFTKSKGITINNMPAQTQATPGTPDLNQRENRIYSRNDAYANTKGTTYTALMTYTLPKETVLTSVPSYARNTDNGKLIESSQGEFSNGQIQIVPLTKKPLKLKSSITGQTIELEAGTLITDDLLLEAALNDVDYEYTTVAFGAFTPTGAKDAVPTYFKSKDTENAIFYGSMTKPQAEQFKESLKTVQKGVEEFKSLAKDEKEALLRQYGKDIKPMFEKLGEGGYNKPQSTLQGKAYSFTQLKEMGVNLKDYKKTKDGNYVKK